MSDLTLTPAFNYYYVAHDLWGRVTGQMKNDSNHHLQYVPKGSDVYSTAGAAGRWLGDRSQTLTRLVMIGHGGPGHFFLGEEITSENVAPLGGWLYSFFEDDSSGIQILGCESAADSVQMIGKYQYGQANPLNDPSLSHRGYELLLRLAQASTQIVEGALYGQSSTPLRLQGPCRRVYSDGKNEIFTAA